MSINDALEQIGAIVLEGVPENCGYLFRADKVRLVLDKFAVAIVDEFDVRLRKALNLKERT